MDFGIIAALATALFGPVIAYLAAARRLSGRIDTSEAAQLWQEASNLRSEYKREIEELRGLVGKLRDRVLDLETKNEQLALENGELKLELIKVQKENRRLKARIEELEEINHHNERE